ncbi:MAG: hypothetical protein Tsb009_29570 [Planctomycetaceae bacterium]
MKGLQGLAIAAAMGVVGAVCNWFYISQRAADLEKVDFIYVKADAKVNAGDKLKESHLGRVSIPKKFLGNLQRVGVLWRDRKTAVGVTVHRSFTADELLLQSDLTTVPQKSLSQLLGLNERAQPVQVDATTFIASNFNPNDYVYFSEPPGTGGLDPAKVNVEDMEVGPFRIIAVGDRLGSRDIARAAGMRESRGNILTVPLKIDKDGKYDKKSQKLLALLAKSRGKGLSVSIVSAQQKIMKAQ